MPKLDNVCFVLVGACSFRLKIAHSDKFVRLMALVSAFEDICSRASEDKTPSGHIERANACWGLLRELKYLSTSSAPGTALFASDVAGFILESMLYAASHSETLASSKVWSVRDIRSSSRIRWTVEIPLMSSLPPPIIASIRAADPFNGTDLSDGGPHMGDVVSFEASYSTVLQLKAVYLRQGGRLRLAITAAQELADFYMRSSNWFGIRDVLASQAPNNIAGGWEILPKQSLCLALACRQLGDVPGSLNALQSLRRFLVKANIVLRPQYQKLMSELLSELGIVDAVDPPLLSTPSFDHERLEEHTNHTASEQVELKAVDSDLVANLATKVSESRLGQPRELIVGDMASPWTVGSQGVVEFETSGLSSDGSMKYCIAYSEYDWLLLGSISGTLSTANVAISCVPLRSGRMSLPLLRAPGTKGETISISSNIGKQIYVLPSNHGRTCVGFF